MRQRRRLIHKVALRRVELQQQYMAVDKQVAHESQRQNTLSSQDQPRLRALYVYGGEASIGRLESELPGFCVGTEREAGYRFFEQQQVASTCMLSSEYC